MKIVDVSVADLAAGLDEGFSSTRSTGPSLVHCIIDSHASLLVLLPPAGRRFVFAPEFRQVWWRDARRWVRQSVRPSASFEALRPLADSLNPAFLAAIGLQPAIRAGNKELAPWRCEQHEFLIPGAADTLRQCAGFLQLWFDSFGLLTTAPAAKLGCEEPVAEPRGGLLQDVPFFGSIPAMSPERMLAELQSMDRSDQARLLREIFRSGGFPGLRALGEGELESRRAWTKLFMARLGIMRESLIPESY